MTTIDTATRRWEHQLSQVKEATIDADGDTSSAINCMGRTLVTLTIPAMTSEVSITVLHSPDTSDVEPEPETFVAMDDTIDIASYYAEGGSITVSYPNLRWIKFQSDDDEAAVRVLLATVTPAINVVSV